MEVRSSSHVSLVLVSLTIVDLEVSADLEVSVLPL
jgi:hypothetical protein